MTNPGQHRGWSWRRLLRVANGALALGVALGQVVVATPSAKAQADATFTVLYSFKWDFADGAFPYAGVVLDAAGNLYGTTYWGGASGLGTVFKLDTTGAETVLHSFNGGDGSNPADLIRDANGNLYGTTQFGGASDAGTVFKLDTTGAETVLHSFVGPPTDGLRPIAGLVRDAGGSLYGTTLAGGSSSNCGGGCGTVFRLDTTGAETVLHSFAKKRRDGKFPYAGLVRDAAGNLYGTTVQGGASNNCVGGCGTVFRLDTTGGETLLHRFVGGSPATDGERPGAGLVRDAAGNLYGTTPQGGAYGAGTVFKVSH
jgi:uncharacterized repeat protein (TIGR03803 family)